MTGWLNAPDGCLVKMSGEDLGSACVPGCSTWLDYCCCCLMLLLTLLTKGVIAAAMGWLRAVCLSRCNMVPGYVVPRSQVAFSQPTEEGAKLAVAFAGTREFMVYSVE